MKSGFVRQAAPLAACFVAMGCAESTPADVPWDVDRATVIRPGDGDVDLGIPEGDDCLDLDAADDKDCLRPQDECAAGEAADVIVDGDGSVLEVVCLPAKVDVITPGEVIGGELAQTENKTAIVFDSTVEDDLEVDANNVLLYAENPDDATMVGDLTLEGNNATVRGLTIDGDVIVEKNDAIFVYCRITGDLIIRGNNTAVSGCEVFGNVMIIEGANNTVLKGNLVGGELDLGGGNTDCEGNQSFEDENEDGKVDDDEVGDALRCK